MNHLRFLKYRQISYSSDSTQSRRPLSETILGSSPLPYRIFYFFAILLLAGGIGGCARRAAVEHQANRTVYQELAPLRNELNQIREEVRNQKQDIEQLKTGARESAAKISAVEEALQRTEKGGGLTQGKLLYEVTLSDESVPFGYDDSRLSKDAQDALDAFAKALIAENRGVYIEIQGHTDNIGSEAYNLELGRQRAEAVMGHLYSHHSIPLRRMSIFSYGETRPVAGNDTETGRAKNRRVVMMVME